MMQADFFQTVAMSSLVIETAIIIVLLVGWLYGARRLDFRIHHWAVYSTVLVNSILVGLWMIPQAVALIAGNYFADPMASLHVSIHLTIGLVTVVLSIIVSFMFLARRGMPLKLLKRTRPAMILILGLWTITFLLGVMTYTTFW